MAWEQGDSCAGNENKSNCEHILKVESTGFTDGIHMRSERKKMESNTIPMFYPKHLEILWCIDWDVPVLYKLTFRLFLGLLYYKWSYKDFPVTCIFVHSQLGFPLKDFTCLSPLEWADLISPTRKDRCFSGDTQRNQWAKPTETWRRGSLFPFVFSLSASSHSPIDTVHDKTK